MVTFLRCSQQFSVFPKQTLWWVWNSDKINDCIIFSTRDLALVLLREGERRFLKSRSGLTSTSCDPYYKHTVKYLASDLPRRWFRDEDKPVLHEWFRLRCFAFTHYIMQRTEGSFLTTSLQNLICIIYAQYPQSAKYAQYIAHPPSRLHSFNDEFRFVFDKLPLANDKGRMWEWLRSSKKNTIFVTTFFLICRTLHVGVWSQRPGGKGQEPALCEGLVEVQQLSFEQ